LEFVGLPYRFKTNASCTPVLSLLPGVKYDGTKLSEVQHVGSGLLLLKRNVFEKLSATHPDWKHKLRESGVSVYSERKGARDFAYTFFAEGFDSEGYMLTEDFKLCEDWRALGGKVHLAAWAKTEHHGSFSYIWNGQ
jgi:hypothetical protein